MANVKKTVKDPVLGILEVDEYEWSMTRKLPKFGQPVQITFSREGDEELPSEEQRHTFQEVVLGKKFYAQIEAGLWKYYEDVVVGNYRGQMSPKEAARCAPDLKSGA